MRLVDVAENGMILSFRRLFVYSCGYLPMSRKLERLEKQGNNNGKEDEKKNNKINEWKEPGDSNFSEIDATRRSWTRLTVSMKWHRLKKTGATNCWFRVNKRQSRACHCCQSPARTGSIIGLGRTFIEVQVVEKAERERQGRKQDKPKVKSKQKRWNWLVDELFLFIISLCLVAKMTTERTRIMWRTNVYSYCKQQVHLRSAAARWQISRYYYSIVNDVSTNTWHTRALSHSFAFADSPLSLLSLCLCSACVSFIFIDLSRYVSSIELQFTMKSTKFNSSTASLTVPAFIVKNAKEQRVKVCVRERTRCSDISPTYGNETQIIRKE